jgi:multidrug efflux pump subunit AcrA (membrane-fusion protein)
MALTGCETDPGNSAEGHNYKSQQSHEETEQKEPEAQGILFREGKGLEIPEKTRASLKLKVSEVSEGELQSTLIRTGQIYKGPEEHSTEKEKTSLASVMLIPSDAEGIDAHSKVLVNGADSGIVAAVNRTALSATGQVEVLVAIRDKSAKYKVGNSVQVGFSSTSKDRVTLISRSALLETVSGNFVYVPNGKYFFRTAVTVGTKTDTTVEVTDGLYPGDEVVSEPVMSLWLAELQATKGGVGCAHGH